MALNMKGNYITNTGEMLMELICNSSLLCLILGTS